MPIANAQTMTEAQADSTAKEQLAKMNLKQKVYEMHGHGIIKFGLSLIFNKKITALKAGGNEKLGIIPTAFFDGPRGIGHYHGATAFPVTMARGASWDRDLERRIGEAMAEEIRALDGNYSGAVCMNLLRHPAWGRSQETYGEDPYHVGEMACALTDGIQKHRVQACAKHFAGNSMENNRFGGSINMDKRTLYEVYLPHFKKVVQHGVASVMSAYSKLNGEYCGHNKILLTDILRKEWGFKGYVTSDWAYGLFDAQKGIEAGMNIEMPRAVYYKFGKVKKLIREGKIKEQQIDDLILPILRTKLLFTKQKDTQTYPMEIIGSKEHIALAREAAEKSAVLLKNKNNILPLDKSKVKRIAVIGSLCETHETGDHGSSHVTPAYVISPLDGIKEYFKGTNTEVLTAAANDMKQIKAICENADAVIVIAGMTYLDEGEYIGNGSMRDKNNPDKKSIATRTGVLGLGGDRKYLHLHQKDIDVIHAAAAVNKNIVVSLIAGSAVTVEEWHEEVPAILETFYNGMEGGAVLGRILFGDVCPSGKLPFTVPKLESDLPPFDSYADSARYGYYHGYTLFDKEKKSPRYAFGYGLSYTSFQLSDVHVGKSEISANDSLQVFVKVKNSGAVTGGEVVQLYVHFSNTQIEMPEKLLRGFQKVYLQPGEERVIEFAVPAADLAYYNVATNQWEIEKRGYKVSVGNSSEATGQLSADFSIR